MFRKTSKGKAENNPMGGYTLLEVVMVLAIGAAVLMWGMPSLVASIRNNDVASQSVGLLAMLNFTKSEAIRRNGEVNMVFSMGDEGWEVVVEDPNNEIEIEGCVPGQLRCVKGMSGRLVIPRSLLAESEPEPVESEGGGIGGIGGTEPVTEPEPEADPTYRLSFNNRGYIRGSDDPWVRETIFLEHRQCGGTNQRVRIDITPTGQISSCNLACSSTAECQ